MKLVQENIYHIYNRGNDSQRIFFSKENYKFLLNKIENYLKPHVDILSYCLMPNHFHFMVYIPEIFEQAKYSDDFKIMLTSYTRAINIQEKRTGSLFQQHSKAKCLTDLDKSLCNYSLICLNYIHLNPLRAGLVKKAEDWEYSSFKEYLGLQKKSICNINLAIELMGLSIDKKEFYKNSLSVLDNSEFEKLF